MKFQMMLTLVILTITFTLAHAGGNLSGGGDECERRIKEIRTDLKTWIQNKGHHGLQFQQGQTADQYENSMLAYLENKSLVIKCVGPGDQGYPVEIRGVPKVCRFDDNPSERASVTCDFIKFLSLSDSAQYVKSHHEFAGLAKLELPNPQYPDSSNYFLSEQISYYLVDTVVKKLAIVKKASEIETIVNQYFPKLRLDLKMKVLAKAEATLGTTHIINSTPELQKIYNLAVRDIAIEVLGTIEIEKVLERLNNGSKSLLNTWTDELFDVQTYLNHLKSQITNNNSSWFATVYEIKDDFAKKKIGVTKSCGLGGEFSEMTQRRKCTVPLLNISVKKVDRNCDFQVTAEFYILPSYVYAQVSHKENAEGIFEKGISFRLGEIRASGVNYEDENESGNCYKEFSKLNDLVHK